MGRYTSCSYIYRSTLTGALALVLGLAAQSLLAQSGNVLLDSEGSKGKLITDVKPADVVFWSFDTASVAPSGRVRLGIRLRTEQDFTLYAEKIKFAGPSGFALESVDPPASITKDDPLTGKPTQVYGGGEFVLTFQGPKGFDAKTFSLSVSYTACTGTICLFPYTAVLDIPAFGAEERALAAPAPIANPSFAPSTEAAIKQGSDQPAEDIESQLATRLSAGKFSFWMLLAVVFVGGLLTNLTPCVAPMIPITVRLLAGQAKTPLLSASLYALGILVTYTLLGLFAALSGGMFGSLLASPTFNIVFACIMIALGLSMLGFGDFSKLQQIGSRIGAGKPSPFNTFLMGTGAGLVASPCTGPILAALLTYTAKNQDITQSTILLMVYSLGFALPYVFLGGAAARVAKVRVSFRIQIVIKLVFSSVMFALGLYYLRIPAYELFSTLRPLWPTLTVLGLTVGVILCTLWVIAPWLHNSKASNMLPTFLLAFGIFSGTQWYTTRGASEHEAQYQWYQTEEEAFAAAKAANKPILIDAWAEWCEACKKMDVTTFADPAVVKLLSQHWILLKLDLTEADEKNDKLQEKYGLQSLPTLTLIPPSGDLASKEQIMGYVSAGTLLNRLRNYRAE